MIRIGSLDYKFEIYFLVLLILFSFLALAFGCVGVLSLRNLELFINLVNEFRVTLSVLRLEHNFDSALLLLFG